MNYSASLFDVGYKKPKPKDFVPHVWQTEAIRLMLRKPAAGLLCWPGAGKTACVYAAFKILKAKRIARRMLVIAPLKPCYLVWPGERDKWTQFQDLEIEVLHGKDRDAALRSKAEVKVINPEGLDWLLRQRALDQFDMLVVDESSKFKSTKTQRWRALKGALKFFKRRYILTGSPAPNGLMDLFGQIYLLDCGAALGQYITHYRMQYFIPGGFGGYEWYLREGADKEIHQRIRPIVLRPDDTAYRKSLPPLVEVDVKVDLPSEARKLYNQMEDDLIISIENKEVKAASAAVASMKLRQIANGAVYADLSEDAIVLGLRKTRLEFGARNGAREVIDIHSAKIEALRDLIAELEGQPAFIAYEFRHEYERISKALGGGIPQLAGGVPMKQQIATAHRWNAGELPALLVQPQSVAHGLNLQGAGRAIIWYGLTWSLEDYEQLIQRIWRQGKIGQLFNYRIIANDTVDCDQVLALGRKGATQTDLFNALVRRARARRRKG